MQSGPASIYLHDKELLKALEAALKVLEDRQLMPKITKREEREQFLNQTLQNIKKGMDSIEKVDLHTPSLQSKLMTALVATFIKEKKDATFKFDFNCLAKDAKPDLRLKELNKLDVAYQHLNKKENRFLLTLHTSAKALKDAKPDEKLSPSPKPRPGGKKSSATEDTEDFMYPQVTDDAGNTLMIDFGAPQVSTKQRAKAMLTLSELLAGDLDAGVSSLEKLGKDAGILSTVQNAFSDNNLLSNTPKLSKL